MTQTITPLQLRESRSDYMAEIGILPIYDYDEQYWIKSQVSSKKYKTTLNSCTCPDNKKGYICKHILLLKKHLDKEDIVVLQTPAQASGITLNPNWKESIKSNRHLTRGLVTTDY